MVVSTTFTRHNSLLHTNTREMAQSIYLTVLYKTLKSMRITYSDEIAGIIGHNGVKEVSPGEGAEQSKDHGARTLISMSFGSLITTCRVEGRSN